ncbi:MAG: aldo/keto reductase [Alphaproteobacteria bacterium]|nr:aldo/keto reductase [Alphaproteobacteria bacterium]
MPNELARYRILGHTGLRVAPICLGGLSFGSSWGVGADIEESHRIIDLYVDRGGNFIDTASVYNGGESEEILGSWLKGHHSRVVLSSKYSMADNAMSPNECGNSRKSMIFSVEKSLRRLRTDYLDILYVHMWDNTTAADEVLRGLQDLIAQGKILYSGLSDTPAWQASRMQAIAETRGWSRFAAYQLEYSLVERTAEREVIPMCQAMSFAMTGWGLLGGGMLTGAYSALELRARMSSAATLDTAELQIQRRVSAKSLIVLETLEEIASELGRSPAQVAIAWAMRAQQDLIPLVGGRTAEQVAGNLDALCLSLDVQHFKRLAEASAVELGFPHEMLSSDYVKKALSGGFDVPGLGFTSE